jgi:hypothetical protein
VAPAELGHPLRPPPGHARPAPELHLDPVRAGGDGDGPAGRSRGSGAVPRAREQEEGRPDGGFGGGVSSVGDDRDGGLLDQRMLAGGHRGGRRWGFRCVGSERGVSERRDSRGLGERRKGDDAFLLG